MQRQARFVSGVEARRSDSVRQLHRFLPEPAQVGTLRGMRTTALRQPCVPEEVVRPTADPYAPPCRPPNLVQRSAHSLLRPLVVPGEALTRYFSRLEVPSLTPQLSRPLMLPFSYLFNASITCALSFAGGLLLAAGNAAFLPPSVLLAIYGGTRQTQKFLVDPWVQAVNAGIDDALAEEFGGWARLAENHEAAQRFQTMTQTLRRQYFVILENICSMAASVGSVVGTVGISLTLTGALLPSLPPLAALGLTVAIYGLVQMVRIWSIPQMEQWRQQQENTVANQGAQGLAILSGGTLDNYLCMGARHDDEKNEMAFRNRCAKMLRHTFSIIEAALFVGVFGVRDNNVTLFGHAIMSAVVAGRNINVCMARVRGVRDEFCQDFLRGDLSRFVHEERIHPQRLEAFGGASSDLHQMVANMLNLDPSLWVLEGQVGSGKSTLLRLAKQSLGMNADYVPAHSTFGKGGRPLGSQSSGEGMTERLEEVLQLCEAEDREAAPGQLRRSLLLDEPLAPLDPQRKEQVMHRLHRLARHRCVVLIHHAGSVDAPSDAETPASSANDLPSLAAAGKPNGSLRQRAPAPACEPACA